MPYTGLVLFLQQGNSAANATYTFSTSNQTFSVAQNLMQNISKNGGAFDDQNNWYPSSAICKVSAI